ncbi:MAG: hypothetical protein E6J90_22680 [Deltaproteobacteria bacterium]|nr:MAG: hypothetical protein E6J91_26365 [Deltaproteobacteria bacterium]TMQ17128.1 MAG: hypothetical protein E6J90_22680 [Deltaproteobacteria bacterium]
MRSLIWLVVIASCTSQADDYPVRFGDGVPPIQTTTGTTARVCVIVDPRNLGSCSPGAAGGLTVTLGNTVTTTAPDGSFTVPAASTPGTTPGAMVVVSGAGMVPTAMALTATGASGTAVPASIPVLQADLFSQMLAANGITPRSGSGSIVGSVTRGGQPVSGVTVTSTPSPAFRPLFDGSTPTAFTLDATGARGVVWIPGVAAGTAQLTFRDLATSGETIVGGVPVIDGGITIMDAVLP